MQCPQPSFPSLPFLYFFLFAITGADAESLLFSLLQHPCPFSVCVPITNVGQEALRQRLKLLTEEKSDLQAQLMDCHLRIEQEGKVQLTAQQNNKSLSPESKCLCCFA